MIARSERRHGLITCKAVAAKRTPSGFSNPRLMGVSRDVGRERRCRNG